MDLQPTLENERVKIRPLEYEDLEPLYEVAKDPKIWEQHPSKRYQKKEFEKFFAESIASKCALAILDKSTDNIIGSSRFKTVEGNPNAIEIGWTFLGRNYWGGTYNKEVKGLMMTHAFNHVQNAIFYVDKDNIRSQKAVEKINGRKLSESERAMLPKKSKENETYIIEKSAQLR